MFFRYSRWDGTQQVFPFDADAVMDTLSDDLIAGGDLRDALQRLFRKGLTGSDGQRLRGLQDLVDKLRRRRQEELDRYDLGSVLDDVRKRLDDVLAAERSGIERRVDEGQDQLERKRAAGEQSADEDNLQRLLERIAAKKRRILDQLPPDVGGRIKALSDYEFMDAGARQQFRELLQTLQRQMLQQTFQGMQQAIQSLRPEDMQHVREMVRDLNAMLREKQQGGSPDFQQFMQKYGDMFPPGIDSLDDLVEHLQRQNAQMQSLLDSMSQEQRQALQDMMDALLRDDRLKWDLAQLGANLEQILPMRDLKARYRFKGEESLTLSEALGVMDQLQQIDGLERELRGAQYGSSDLDQIDPSKVKQLLGEDAQRELEQMKDLIEMLREAGYIQKSGSDWELTPRGLRHIGEKALQDIFAQLRKGRLGKHETDQAGRGGDRTDDNKPYEFGDPFLLDLQETLMNAIERNGVGTPVRMRPDDFAVYRTEVLTQCSTVLMVDMSRSMALRGCFLAAKKVALALNSLIHGQFPKDNLYIVTFSEYARQVKPADLARITLNDFEMGTNMHHAFVLARRLLGRHKAGTREIIMVTDGEPTAHLLPDGHAYFDYPPDPATISETLKEVVRCTRERIIINTFMLGRTSYLIDFVNRMTKINKGRAFFATPEHLGEYILVDYVNQKARRIAG